ncbi:MAG: ferredoxin [Ruminococcaceae bacterium]|nr:ferredoxin [Oscillospiraceae bacterium]
MQVTVVEGCIACGLCVETCPEVFRMGDDGLAEAYARPNENNEASAQEAAEGCPVSVIITEP